jgi:hypothetical protein
VASGISDEDLKRIVALFEMSERASREDADAHVKNEAANAVPVLLRLLGKHGLSLGDVPELQRRYEQNEAAKGAKAGAAKGADQPNVVELIQHMLKGFIDAQPHEYTGIALWILHTHVVSRFQISPRLAALSRCVVAAKHCF